MPASTSLILVKAGTLVDGENIDLSPGGLLLARSAPGTVGYRILAADSLREVESHPLARDARVIDRLDSVVCPALVNAHAHLDLSHIGPWQLPSPHRFEDFIAKVRAERKTDEAGIRASVRLGIEASRRGGVVAVGDIAGAARGVPQTSPFREMHLSHFLGTSYIEFFAMGNGEAAGLERIRTALDSLGNQTSDLCKFGIHPHSPYSVSLRGYRAALDLHRSRALPICSHIAESPAERQFVASGEGAFRDFLNSLSLWNGTPEGIGLGKTPVAHISALPDSKAIRYVHLNDLSEQDIGLLAPESIAVYCPRSSAYFGAESVFGPHKYRQLIQRGIKVALGTDSILNLVDQPSSHFRISTWDEMRLLRRRDATDPRLLLTMATTWGAQAIDMPTHYFQLKSGLSVIDLIGIMSPNGGGLVAALEGESSPELLLYGI